MNARERQAALAALAHRLRKGLRITYEEAQLLYAASEREWDDAIHVRAPWDSRVSLCGGWERNLVGLDEQMPDAASGCWTCLSTADWLRKHYGPERA